MQSQDPVTPHLSSNAMTESAPQISVSHTEFYDERVMTQEIEALTLISNTQEIAAVPPESDSD